MKKRLKKFLVAMEYKFILHQNKGSFDWKSRDKLIEELEREIGELKQAKTKEEVVSECADIANYAFMIADKILRGVEK